VNPAVVAFVALFRRDLLLAMRRRGDMANPLIFFVMVVSIFPLALGGDPRLLAAVAPGVVWVAALLAALMSMDALFREDFADGSLEQMLLSPCPHSVLVGARVLAHWLLTGLPLVLLAPLLALLLNLPTEAMPALLLSLLLGTPVLSLVGAIGVALTVGLRRGGMLLALLMLPLYIPVLIFGAGAVEYAASGQPWTAPVLFLAAILALAVTLAPPAAAAALRVTMGE